MDDPKPVSPNRNEQDTSDELLDQPYDEKQAETYETPTGEPTTIEPLPTPLSLQKPKSHVGRWFVRGFVILIIAALGALAYYQWTETQSANNERASLQSELETVKAANKSAIVTDSEEPEVTPIDDKEMVTNEAKSYISALQNSPLTVREVEVEGDFAIVTAAKSDVMSADGIIIVFEKVNNSWVMIHSGPDDITTGDIDMLVTDFGVPKKMLD